MLRFPAKPIVALIAFCWLIVCGSLTRSNAGQLQAPADGSKSPGYQLWPDEFGMSNVSSADSKAGNPTRRAPVATPILDYTGTELWTYYTNVVARDSALYALSLNGIEAFDISDRTQPQLRYRLPLAGVQEFAKLCLAGNYLYLGRNEQLIVIDVTSPYLPVEVTRLPLSGILMEIEIHGNRAYVGVARTQNDITSQSPGWYILDLTIPQSPTVIGSYTPATRHKDCRNFEIKGNVVFAVNLWDSLLEVIDISNESDPQHLATHPMYSLAQDIALRGDDVYLLLYGILRDYNISNPLLPVYKTGIASSGKGMVRFGDRLYVATGEGVKLLSLPSPGTISEITTYLPRFTHYSLGVVDSILLVPEIYFGFSLVDISEPFEPLLTGEYSPPALGMKGVAANSTHAYLVNYFSVIGLTGEVNRVGILAVDVADPANPQFVAWEPIAEGNPRNPLLYDSLLIINQCQPTRIYSIADPDHPTFLSQFPYFWTQSWESTIWNGLLVTAALGIVVGDISNPALPITLLHQSFSNLEPLAVVVDSGIAYMAGFYVEGTPTDGFLQVIDINFLDSPVLLGTISLEDNNFSPSSRLTEQLIKRGNYLYITDWVAGLKIVDVSQPNAPELVNTLLPGQVSFLDVAVKDNLLFAATYSAVMVFDLLDPEHPQLLQQIELAAHPERLAVVGDLLHIGCDYGYWIFTINPPVIDCGDADGNGTVTISDAVYLINFIFVGGPAPVPVLSGDANGDHFVSVSDVVFLINYIFAGGPAPCE